LFTENLLSLLAALTSTNPESTISVRSAYEMSLKPNIKLYIKKFLKEVKNCGAGNLDKCPFTDLKNCILYYAGNSSAIHEGQSMVNFDDITNICNEILYTSVVTPHPIEFISDEHLSIFLSLYKSSKKGEIF